MAIKPAPAEFGVKTEAELLRMILSRSVMLPWVQFRDNNPQLLRVGHHVPGPHTPINNTNKSLSLVMAALQTTAASIYDWPEDSEISKWTVQTHFECLVYKTCKNLAQPNEPFEKPFANAWPRCDTKAYDARVVKVTSVMRLASYLIRSYAESFDRKEPVPIVQRMEDVYPTANLEHSPTFSVRRQAELGKASRKDLIVTVTQLLSEVATKQELIDYIMKMEAIKQTQPSPTVDLTLIKKDPKT
ncbi:hypothetical protein BU16DRAFT_254903 [Lophium mytilinum]|uniref:Uncharacterized protein n=1 Tax=Lophium mytilinum TaxID=390894 RepID=A0A6A6R7U2_9PEZI|nr:hypothetical protein BU16DRAFT_254903 [Lophium mytilinum]